MQIWPFITLTIAGLSGVLAAHRHGSQLGLWLCKPVASSGFVATALFSGALDSTFGTLILGGLLLCWLGDILLISRATPLFAAGLFSFLLGHLAFAAAFAQLAPDPTVVASLALLLVLPGIMVARWLRPHLDRRMRTPVHTYIVAIGAMAALALAATAATGRVELAIGAACFCVSDMGVARDRFVKPGFDNQVWLLPLYYGAQLLFAISVLP